MVNVGTAAISNYPSLPRREAAYIYQPYGVIQRVDIAVEGLGVADFSCQHIFCQKPSGFRHVIPGSYVIEAVSFVHDTVPSQIGEGVFWLCRCKIRKSAASVVHIPECFIQVGIGDVSACIGKGNSASPRIVKVVTGSIIGENLCDKPKPVYVICRSSSISVSFGKESGEGATSAKNIWAPLSARLVLVAWKTILERWLNLKSAQCRGVSNGTLCPGCQPQHIRCDLN